MHTHTRALNAQAKFKLCVSNSYEKQFEDETSQFSIIFEWSQREPC